MGLRLRSLAIWEIWRGSTELAMSMSAGTGDTTCSFLIVFNELIFLGSRLFELFEDFLVSVSKFWIWKQWLMLFFIDKERWVYIDSICMLFIHSVIILSRVLFLIIIFNYYSLKIQNRQESRTFFIFFSLTSNNLFFVIKGKK